MNAEQIESIINAHIGVRRTDIEGFVAYRRGALRHAITLSARDIAQAMAEEEIPTVTIPNPPEPPKTILPDMSRAKTGRYYWFLAEDGTPVVFFKEYDFDNEPWCVNGFHLSANKVIVQFPHLGRLHKTGPGEVAE